MVFATAVISFKLSILYLTFVILAKCGFKAPVLVGGLLCLFFNAFCEVYKPA